MPVARLRLANPMTAEQEYLRPDLRANLLDTLRQDRRHEEGGLRLFELGKVFWPRPNDLPEEPEMLCGLLNGLRSEKSWLTAEQSLDFFDAKGVVETLMAKLGIAAGFEPGNDAGLHPVRQAAIVIGGQRVGALGEIHPRVAHAFEFAQPVYLFELNVAALVSPAPAIRMYQPMPRYPRTARDIDLVVDQLVGFHAPLPAIDQIDQQTAIAAAQWAICSSRVVGACSRPPT